MRVDRHHNATAFKVNDLVHEKTSDMQGQLYDVSNPSNCVWKLKLSCFKSYRFVIGE